MTKTKTVFFLFTVSLKYRDYKLRLNVNVPGICRSESNTLHWICPVLCDTQFFHSPWYMAWAVMMLSPT